MKALELARLGKSNVTTGSAREQKGGDVALRGMGLSIFARAFLHCKEAGMPFDTMASKLETVDWHVLTCEKSELPAPHQANYGTALDEHAQSTWQHLLVRRETGSRISSSSNDADVAWNKICKLVGINDLSKKQKAIDELNELLNSNLEAAGAA